MKFERLVIRTYGNPDLNKAVQEKLFELGYKWPCNGNKVQFDQNHHVGTHANGDLDRSWGEEVNGFREFDGHKEISINELMEIQRETIRVGSFTFYKDDFEKAIANLERL